MTICLSPAPSSVSLFVVSCHCQQQRSIQGKPRIIRDLGKKNVKFLVEIVIMRLIVLIWGLLVPPSLCADFGFLDWYEMDKVQYAISISSQPVALEEQVMLIRFVIASHLFIDRGLQQVTPESTVMMTNKFGQKYRCALPILANPETDQDQLEDNVPQTLDEFMDSLKKALEPMEFGLCLTKTQDWWTYELCPGRSIKQYHLNMGKVEGDVINLGNFERNQEWTDSERLDSVNPKHHKQYFTNGTVRTSLVKNQFTFISLSSFQVCDLTGRLRRSEVRLFCDESAGADKLVVVHEPSSCEYEIKVHTRRLCNIPEFQPPPENKPKDLICYPALTEAQFQVYHQRERDRVANLERRRAQALNQQKEKMVQFLGTDLPFSLNLNDEKDVATLEELVEQKMANSILDKLGDALKDLFPNFAKDPVDKKSQFLQMVKDVSDKVQRKAASKKKFDLDSERRVRSDVVSEEDMMEELKASIKNLSPEQQKQLKKGEDLNAEVQKSLDDIIKETEQEMGSKLDPVQKRNLDEFTERMEELLANLDSADAKIQDLDKEIAQVDEVIASKEKQIEDISHSDLNDMANQLDDHLKHDGKKSVKKDLKDDVDDKESDQEPRDHLKHDNKRSVKRELREEQEASEEIKEKLSKMNEKKGDHREIMVNRTSCFLHEKL